MFKKRVLADRTYRLSKRGFRRSVREKTGYSASDSDASSNIILPKSKLIRLRSNTVRMPGRKNSNDDIIIPDGFGGSLELKNDEIGSIEGELSNLSLQLSLFLDAGLVVSSAFDELIYLNRDNERLIYRVLSALNKECKEKNLALINELFILAQKIRSKSLMRFASLIMDNRSKGSTLSEKLDKERSQMQNERLSFAKAKAKEAETKLCFPLMLLLISLITICSAPALMQM